MPWRLLVLVTRASVLTVFKSCQLFKYQICILPLKIEKIVKDKSLCTHTLLIQIQISVPYNKTAFFYDLIKNVLS